MSAAILLLPAVMVVAVWFLAALDVAVGARSVGRRAGVRAAVVEPVRAASRAGRRTFWRERKRSNNPMASSVPPRPTGCCRCG